MKNLVKDLRCSILPIVFFLSTITFSIKAETVYLKNGSVIHGTIIEEYPNKQYSIQTGDGSIVTLNVDEIEKITRVIPTNDNRKTGYTDPGFQHTLKYKGFVGNASGFGSYYTDLLFVNNGIEINNSLFIGVGTGLLLDAEYDFCDYVFAVPIYVVGRYEFHNFINRRLTPFMELNIGYNIPYSQYIKLDVGYHYKFNNRYGIGAGLGLINLGDYVGANLTIAFDW